MKSDIIKSNTKYLTNIKEVIINELNKPASIHFKRRRVVIYELHDMNCVNTISKYNKRNKYIPIIIHCFQNLYTPLKRKSEVDAINTMNSILQKKNKKNPNNKPIWEKSSTTNNSRN